MSYTRYEGSSRAKGILMGIAYGDAIVNSSNATQMSFDTYDIDVPQSTTAWTNLARAEAEAIEERTGFDEKTVASALTDAVPEPDADGGSNLPPQTLLSIPRNYSRKERKRVIDNTDRQEKNFEPLVRNCVLAPAFRSFPEELEYVTYLSTGITADSEKIKQASAKITQILAELIKHDSDEGHIERLGNLRGTYTHPYPRLDLGDIHESVADLREDVSRDIKDLPYLNKEEGSAEFFLRGALFTGFGTDDAELALATADNSNWHPEVLTPLVGAIVGARFGTEAFPDSWMETLDQGKNKTRIHRHGSRLLRVDKRRSTVPTHQTDTPVVHGRPIMGPTYIRRNERYQKSEMLRPEPAPHTYEEVPSRYFTPAQSVFFDWEHRAHRHTEDSSTAHSDWIRVPEYTLVDEVDQLPDQDIDRLNGMARRACENGKEAIELYEDTWSQTLHDELLGEEGSDRIPEHLGYMIRSIVWVLDELDEQLILERLIESKEAVLETTRLLVTLEDYMAVTSDLMFWSENDWSNYPALVTRVQFATGAIRQSIEAIRCLVIRHPEYDTNEWMREGLRGAELE